MCAQIVRLVLFASIAISIGCSERRSLYPVEDPLAVILHDPFEDSEAEELALELSGEFIAPESLYIRLHSDLTRIRSEWGDSVPIVLRQTYQFRYVPGEVVLFLHDEFNTTEWLMRATELDLIRSQYGFDSVEVTENRITLRSRYRINTRYLLAKFERLPGICWGQTTYTSRDAFGAAQVGDTVDYIFLIPGICSYVCSPSRYYWFSSDGDNVDYVGLMVQERNDTIPDQFKAVWNRRNGTSHAHYFDSVRFRDETPPARATDMKFIGEQRGRTGMISFTATGDDGHEGAAYSATVCVATSMITDQNFNSVGFKYAKLNPGFSGDEHVLSFDNLFGDRTNYYAVRFIDCNQNLSGVSNVATSRNIWLNGWTYFNSGNSPLPNDRITCMIRDSRGRLWMGTQNGLVCKDADEWQIYQTSNSGIPYDLITSVAESPDGVLWIGTPHGLGRFDGNEWRVFTTANSDIPKQEIRCLAVAQNGTIWLGYAQYGLVSYDQETWTVYTPQNSPLKGPTINGLLCDSKGALWIASNLNVYRLDGSEWTEIEVTTTGATGADPVGLFEDADGTIWCGTSTGYLNWFDGVQWYGEYKQGWHIRALAQSDRGTIWVGASGGLWRYDARSWFGFSTATTGLPVNHCTGVVAEDPAVLWIATDGKGLCRWDLSAAKLDRPSGQMQPDE